MIAGAELRCPPTHIAASMITPSATETAGINQREQPMIRLRLTGPVDMEDLLDGFLEELRECEREGQRRRVTLGLDRVDRLSRNSQRLGQLALTPQWCQACFPSVRAAWGRAITLRRRRRRASFAVARPGSGREGLASEEIERDVLEMVAVNAHRHGPGDQRVIACLPGELVGGGREGDAKVPLTPRVDGRYLVAGGKS